MQAYAEAIETALAEPDPWHGFCAFIERVCQMQAEDRGFADLLTLTDPDCTLSAQPQGRS